MNDPLSRLPLFATDDEMAIAIVGKKRASQGKRGALILLEARPFPRFVALQAADQCLLAANGTISSSAPIKAMSNPLTKKAKKILVPRRGGASGNTQTGLSLT